MVTEVKQMEKKNQNYSELLDEKIQKEYDAFIERLKGLTVEEVIDRSYEKAMKEEILNMCLNTQCTEEEAKALYHLEDTLGELYQEWLHSDESVYDEMWKRCIGRRMDAVIRKMQKENVQV